MKMIDTDNMLIHRGDAIIAIEESWWDSKETVIDRINKLPSYGIYYRGGRYNGKSFTQTYIDDIAAKYMENDIATIKRFFSDNKAYLIKTDPFAIKQVIFNDPATIVLWADGTKTVVKCQNNDEYDPEKGLAMCIAKKALGNKGNYYNSFIKWLEEYKDELQSNT
jgi:hypothetical protein